MGDRRFWATLGERVVNAILAGDVITLIALNAEARWRLDEIRGRLNRAEAQLRAETKWGAN